MFDNSQIHIDSSLSTLGNTSNYLGNNSVNPLQSDLIKSSTQQQLLTLAGATIIDAWEHQTNPTQALVYSVASIFKTNFAANAHIAFGETFDLNKAETFSAGVLNGNYSVLPHLQFLSGTEMNGALGAYSKDNTTIYLSSDLLTKNSANPTAVGKVLVEETGHFLDAYANSQDSPGDEGEIIAGLVAGKNFSTAELIPLKAEDDSSVFKINGQSISVELATPPDNAGNTTATARNITIGNTVTTYSDFVGDVDQSDYYKFNLTTASNFNLTLDGLSANANVQLLDGNANFIQASYNPGTAIDKINYNLNPGTYFVNVYREAPGNNTNYNLGFTAIPDYAGNTLATARTITTGNIGSTYNDSVGDFDRFDYYKFDITKASNLDIKLNGLTADANIQLLDGSGKFLQASYNRGTADDNISYLFNPGK